MSKNAKKRYKVRRVYSPEEKAELMTLINTHDQWATMAKQRGDVRVLAKHCRVSKTIISRILKHKKGSLDTMRMVARFLLARQIEDANAAIEVINQK